MATTKTWKPATDAENAYFAALEAAEDLEELAAVEAELEADRAVEAENAYFEELEARELEDDDDETAYRLRAYGELRGF